MRALVGADDNSVEGVIPDNFDATSPLKIFTALRNNLSGPLPKSLGTLLHLEACPKPSLPQLALFVCPVSALDPTWHVPRFWQRDSARAGGPAATQPHEP